jgi:hypothetical protein
MIATGELDDWPRATGTPIRIMRSRMMGFITVPSISAQPDYKLYRAVAIIRSAEAAQIRPS